jgi:alpha-amylase
MFALKDNKGRPDAWYGRGGGLGLVGDATGGVPWKRRAVTFLENHDTGFRTEEDGRPQAGHDRDSFANTAEVEQGYAYLLTHPGVPCVYWKHFFDWGAGLRAKITALINARKVAGVHAGSAVDPQASARRRGVYAARVRGARGDLYVRIGGTDRDWRPADAGFAGCRRYAAGDGWAVWVALPGNPPVQQAPLAAPLPVPAYTPGDQIQIPDDWLE